MGLIPEGEVTAEGTVAETPAAVVVVVEVEEEIADVRQRVYALPIV